MLLLGSTPHASEAQEVDQEAEKASLMEADRAMSEAYSTSSSPLDSVMSHFAEDALVLPPDAPMARGKEASRGVFAELEAMREYSLTWRPSMADASGDLGYTIGTYRMQFQDLGGRPVAIDGKYMTVWKKQPDGRWKVAVDMFNGNGAPTPIEP